MPTNHRVRAGECITSIAQRSGFFWETVWDHSENAELKRARQDPNVLLPGDVVHVPDIEVKEEDGNTEARHRFRLKGVPAKLRLRIVEEPLPEQPEPQGRNVESATETIFDDPEREEEPVEDEPRANVPYVLTIDGVSESGQTDDDGRIECPLPPDAQSARLVLDPGTPKEQVMMFNLGHLDPVSELSGVKQRLANLSFDCGDFDNEATPDLAVALRAFQEKHELEVTGEVDDATRDKLVEEHES
ncbi:MAG: peptidoglycan-binding domain-containing protein [Planctomycetota bacterium]